MKVLKLNLTCVSDNLSAAWERYMIENIKQMKSKEAKLDTKKQKYLNF